MMKRPFLIIIISLILIQPVNAKTIKWDVEVQSTNADLLKCIKVVELKSKRSLLNSLAGAGIISQTPTNLTLQNNCKEGIKGLANVKLLDGDGFMVDDWPLQFNVQRKALSKSSFEFLTGPIKWKKIKSALIEFKNLETF
jgi:hypothetical protein|tara:strand:- start:285 stop:704 length:420 start_codon:yes stop_codon:yes gene_type:complete